MNEIKEKKKTTLEFLSSEFSPEMSSEFIQIISKYKGEIVSSAFPQFVKDELSKKFGKGWNVFSGTQFYGVCQYEEGYFIKAKLGLIIIVAFRQSITEEISK